ncbi:MAG: hypothetical protein R3F19_00395 [Verrucomicrobiales bacterium]
MQALIVALALAGVRGGEQELHRPSAKASATGGASNSAISSHDTILL